MKQKHWHIHTLRAGLLSLSVSAVCLMGSLPAYAGTITRTIGEFDGPILTNPTYPQPSVTIGTFTYVIPTGMHITAATVSGYFGTSVAPSTALENLFVGGIKVASCANFADDCWNAPYGVQTAWSYTFTSAQLSALSGGSAAYTVVQTDDFQVESGVTTLTITTATPEPSSLALAGAGLALCAFVRRKSVQGELR